MTGLGNLATPHSGTAVRNTLKFGALSLFTREGQEKYEEDMRVSGGVIGL